MITTRSPAFSGFYSSSWHGRSLGIKCARFLTLWAQQPQRSSLFSSLKAPVMPAVRSSDVDITKVQSLMGEHCIFVRVCSSPHPLVPLQNASLYAAPLSSVTVLMLPSRRRKGRRLTPSSSFAHMLSPRRSFLPVSNTRTTSLAKLRVFGANWTLRRAVVSSRWRRRRRFGCNYSTQSPSTRVAARRKIVNHLPLTTFKFSKYPHHLLLRSWITGLWTLRSMSHPCPPSSQS